VLTNDDTLQYVRRLCATDTSPLVAANYFTKFENHLQAYLIHMARMVSVCCMCFYQCCDLETMISRLEYTRVHFIHVSVSVSRPEGPGLGLGLGLGLET